MHFPALAAVLLATSCAPATLNYINVPVENLAGQDAALARVELDLAALSERLGAGSADQLAFYQSLAFYHTGRTPVAHELLDLDGDGVPDTVGIAIPVPSDGTVITVTWPAESATTTLPAAAEAGLAEARLDESYR